MADTASARPVTMELTPQADSRRAWWQQLKDHREVLAMLARKDFQTKYKRASLGIAWAVAVPVLQASIMAIVFSRVIRQGTGPNFHFATFVMSGVVGFSYFQLVMNGGTTSIVDGASLTDKVWFPRILLVLVPVLSNLVGLLVSVAVVIATMPLLGAPIKPQIVLIVPAVILLVCFAASLAMVMSALHVYFRDTKFLVQATLMVWMYVTPIIYPIYLLKGLETPAELNPLTGVITLFHMATVGSRGPWIVPVCVTIGVTLALIVIAAEAQRQHDRLFVDLL